MNAQKALPESPSGWLSAEWRTGHQLGSCSFINNPQNTRCHGVRSSKPRCSSSRQHARLCKLEAPPAVLAEVLRVAGTATCLQAAPTKHNAAGGCPSTSRAES